MDILKFSSPTLPTRLEYGSVVHGIKKKMWIERFRTAGEFSFEAPVSSGLREALPIGSFISHVGTAEVMVVENHEISEKSDSEAEIKVSGRGYETILEQRIVGTNKAYPSSAGSFDYSMSADETWEQARLMINDHTQTANLLDDDNYIPNFKVYTALTGAGTSVARTIKRGDLYTRLVELLKIDQLGMKTIRPGPWSPLYAGNPLAVVLEIHRGVDRSSSVIYSHSSGELESAEYLWSNKKSKNAAVVNGKWVEVFVHTGPTSNERRIMTVDGNEIDKDYSTAPTGNDLTNVIAAMEQLGYEALAEQDDTSLTEVEVSDSANRLLYRRDFDLGDIISVSGHYNESAQMRIEEFVEIEDENGSKGYPTLTAIS